MNFIARNIPVPRVLDNLIQEYIARARRRVEPDGFRRSKSCMSQLQRYLEQLCALIPPEPGRVQAVEQDVWMTEGHRVLVGGSEPEKAPFVPADFSGL